MNIVDVLRQSQNGQAFDNLARTFGISPAEAEAVVRAVVPKLSAGIERNTLSRGGLADLVEALGQGHDAILDQPNAIGDNAVRSDGDAILGHILGSKDRSRAVADTAALSSGVSSSLIRLMLPYIASLLMGALSKQFKGGIGDILGKMGGSLPGGGGGGGMPQLPRMPDMPQMPGGSGLPRMPDLPRAPGGSMPSQSPLPLPGDPPATGDMGQNPYGDLSDILRKGRMPGGGSIPDLGGAGGGGALWSVVRNILGGILGFQSRGLLSWILRVVVAKYGWAILKSILGGRR